MNFPSFTPLEPPASKCPKCLGWWANGGRACASQGSCPDSELCESLYGDPCVVIIGEDEGFDMDRVCWAWKADEKPCLACRSMSCPDRRM